MTSFAIGERLLTGYWIFRHRNADLFTNATEEKNEDATYFHDGRHTTASRIWAIKTRILCDYWCTSGPGAFTLGTAYSLMSIIAVEGTVLMYCDRKSLVRRAALKGFLFALSMDVVAVGVSGVAWGVQKIVRRSSRNEGDKEG